MTYKIDKELNEWKSLDLKSIQADSEKSLLELTELGQKFKRISEHVDDQRDSNNSIKQALFSFVSLTFYYLTLMRIRL